MNGLSISGFDRFQENYYDKFKQKLLRDIEEAKEFLQTAFAREDNLATSLLRNLKLERDEGNYDLTLQLCIESCTTLVAHVREQQERFSQPTRAESAVRRPIQDDHRYEVARLIFMEEQLEGAKAAPERLRLLALSFLETDIELAVELETSIDSLDVDRTCEVGVRRLLSSLISLQQLLSNPAYRSTFDVNNEVL